MFEGFNIVQAIPWGIAGFALVLLGFRIDARVEERRDKAGELAGKLAANGLGGYFTKFLTCYSRGNYSGCGDAILSMLDTMSDDTTRKAHLLGIAEQAIKTPGVLEGLLLTPGITEFLKHSPVISDLVAKKNAEAKLGP